MPGEARERRPGLHSGQDYTARLGQAEVQREKESNNQFPLAKYYFSYLKRKGEQRPPTFPPPPPLVVGAGEGERTAALRVSEVINLYLLPLPEPSTYLDQTHSLVRARGTDSTHAFRQTSQTFN